MIKSEDKPILSFANVKEWEKWLRKNHSISDGIWLNFQKKDSGKASVYYPEALDVALCYGWIDGIKKSYDAESWLQKFTPRRARSGWSKINTGHVERLVAAGRMQAAGLAQVEEAKRDGRWAKAYESQSKSTIPEDFLKALDKNAKAKKFFATLNKSNLYAISYRLQTAKRSETKEKRIKEILAMLEKGESFHPAK